MHTNLKFLILGTTSAPCAQNLPLHGFNMIFRGRIPPGRLGTPVFSFSEDSCSIQKVD